MTNLNAMQMIQNIFSGITILNNELKFFRSNMFQVTQKIETFLSKIATLVWDKLDRTDNMDNKNWQYGQSWTE